LNRGCADSDRATLNQWQAAGGQRLFKIIISPQFGDRLDFEKLTRYGFDH